ncbi:hypothetical protein EB73_09695 [Mycobacterium sp. SWH-M3]|nr:hypothetical protein EB73_09695 [Mycobacterium sp. SWH-M3]
MGFFFESDVDRRRREAREEWQLREDIKYERRLQSEAKREENAQEREARRAAERRATELKNDRKKQIEEYKKAEIAARPPITRRVGGTRDVKVVTVSHYKASIPVAFLPPHESGHKLVNAVQALAARGKNVSADDAAKANDLYAEIERDYGALLSRLRDHGWWDSLCDSVGVTLTRDGKPRPWKGRYAEGVQKVTLVHSPVIIGVKVAADGLRIRIKARIGDGAGRWSTPAKLDLLRSAFLAAGAPARDLTVSSDARGNIVIEFNDKDPLEGVVPETGEWDDDGLRSLLGIDSNGNPAWIAWKNTSGMVVGGLAGSGKTASMLPVFRGMEGNAELFIFDGKAQRDLHPLRHICRHYDNSGDVDAPLETLEMLEQLRVLRGDALYEKLGAPNFWNLNRAQRRSLNMKPIFVILDEAQVWLKASSSKEKADIQRRILECVENLIRMGRSAGIVVIITTQRPSADSIPTDIRDNAQLKVSFKVADSTMAKMVLGVSPEGKLDPSTIPGNRRGRFVMDTEGKGLVLGQAGYISPDDLEVQLKDAAPVPDQWAVAEAFAGGLRPGMSRPTMPASPVPANAGRGASDTAPTPEQVAAMTPEQRAAWMHQHAIQMGWVPVDTKPPTSGKPETPETEDTDDGAAGDF